MKQLAEKLAHLRAHGGRFLMAAIMDLLPPVLRVAEENVGGFQVRINACGSGRRGQGVEFSGEGEMWPGRDQRADFRRTELGEEAGDEEVFTMQVKASIGKQCVVVRKATEINTGRYVWLQRGTPDGHGAAH